jgi:hypothetical protein
MMRRWTVEETERACRLRAAGRTVREIARLLGRSAGSVDDRFRWINMPEEERQIRRQQKQGNRPRRQESHVNRFRRAPDDVVAARDAVAALELTSNMIVLGDPPPGRSALDHMQGRTSRS